MGPGGGPTVLIGAADWGPALYDAALVADEPTEQARQHTARRAPEGGARQGDRPVQEFRRPRQHQQRSEHQRQDRAGELRLQGGAGEPGRHYVNLSGCGNTLNAGNPAVLRMIMDSLRYWVETMRVDGFRFDLATMIDPETRRQITAMARAINPRVVLIACDPATLARDAGLIVHQAGYRCTHAGVVNMFPHTAHVESMAVFELA